MPRAIFVQPDGSSETLEVAEGMSLMQAAADAGVPGIPGQCGGNAMCATCHVFVDESWLQHLPPADANEDGLLEGTATPRGPGSRLSCQIVMSAALDGIVVGVPTRQ